MQTCLVSGSPLMPLRKKLNLDAYFEFLKQYFLIFKISKIKRKNMTGDHFKL